VRSAQRSLGILVQDRREQRRLRDLQRFATCCPAAPPDAITGTLTEPATAAVVRQVVAGTRAVGSRST
jgi:(p)ppGpp synthase/HD superfamily hydrolase